MRLYLIYVLIVTLISYPVNNYLSGHFDRIKACDSDPGTLLAGSILDNIQA